MTEQTVTPIIIYTTANDLARVDFGALSPYLLRHEPVSSNSIDLSDIVLLRHANMVKEYERKNNPTDYDNAINNFVL